MPKYIVEVVSERITEIEVEADGRKSAMRLAAEQVANDGNILWTKTSITAGNVKKERVRK